MSEAKQCYRILYQNHGNAIGYWEGWVEGNGLVVIQYAKKLDGKPVRKQYQAYAKNEGRANATTPFDQGVSELDSKTRLKVDKGYVRTLKEAEAPTTNPAKSALELKLDVVKHIINARIEQTNAAQKRAANAAERQRLTEILHHKKDQEMMNMSPEDIQKQIDRLSE